MERLDAEARDGDCEAHVGLSNGQKTIWPNAR